LSGARRIVSLVPRLALIEAKGLQTHLVSEVGC